MREYNVEIFKEFNERWALVTAGNEASFNTMTISWGGLGTIWNKSVATVYVRPNRYTYEFMENNEYFTISFFDSEYKKDLSLLGQLSGRDCDKVSQTSLTPIFCNSHVRFSQAKITLVCQKLYWQDLYIDKMPEDVQKNCYSNGVSHRMYIGEVVEVIRNN